MTDTLGIDLGGTNVRAARVDRSGVVVGEDQRETPEGADDLIQLLVGLVDQVGAGAAAAVGVGAAGMIARDGSVAYGPNVVAFRQGFALRARLEEATGLPVVVDNDANAAAWGEFVHGAAADHDDALVITLGTGIGGGIISRGRLVRGARGYAAEIGHFQVVADGPRCACGEYGHWEALASGTALGQLAGERLGISGEELGRAAGRGDAAALAVLDEFADRVAVGLAGLVNILDPGVVVVGGGLVEMGEALLDPVRRGVAERIEAPQAREGVAVVAATLGTRAGVVGAATMAGELVRGGDADG